MSDLKGNDDNIDLDAYFEAARETAPKPTQSLLDRIAVDALKRQSNSQASNALNDRVQSTTIARLRHAVGGWFGVGGLVTATAVGLYIGFSQPDLFVPNNDLAVAFDTEISPLWLSEDLFFEEG